jgi:hypothetical protein
MQPTKICEPDFKIEFSTPLWRSYDVGLLGENHHKMNLIMGEGLLLNDGVAPPFVDHFLHHLVE